MKEIVIISGKGGTGKTSITGCFAYLAGKAMLADCDVDAADLHLITSPEVIRSEDFVSGHLAEIVTDKCTGCGICMDKCRFDAISAESSGTFTVDPYSCEGCGVCLEVCPVDAVEFSPAKCGQWFVSSTRFGPMVHARLGIARENSGKLVSLVRREAASRAGSMGLDLVITDGPPGVGCPVIAAITGASLVVIVSEPTVSGDHDMKRVIELAGHFSIPAVLIINKFDINPEMAEQMENKALLSGVALAGRIPYDRAFTEAQVQGITLMEASAGLPVRNIATIWEKVCQELK